MSADEQSLQDRTAGSVVFQDYARRLIGLARNHLNANLRQRVDPEDVVQSVFRTFLRRQAEGEFEISSPDRLWSLLALITVRKCVAVARRHRREAADAAATVEDGQALWDSVVTAEPSPQAALELTDLIQSLLAGVPADYRPIVVLTLQGEEPAVVADQTRCSLAKVYRIRNYLRDHLNQLAAAE